MKTIILTFITTFLISCSSSYQNAFISIELILNNPDTLMIIQNDSNYFRFPTLGFNDDIKKERESQNNNEIISYLDSNYFNLGYQLKDVGSNGRYNTIKEYIYLLMRDQLFFVARTNYNGKYVTFLFNCDNENKWKISRISTLYLFPPKKNMTKEELDEYFDGL